MHFVDLRDAEGMEKVMKAVKPLKVFHLAAYGSTSSQADFERMLQTNVIATNRLVRLAVDSKAESVICAGSSSEYGFRRHAPNEDEAPQPNSDYAATKAAGTMLCSHLSHDSCVVRTLRIYSAYGPYESPSRLMPTLIREAMRGRLPELTTPLSAHDFVHVDDVVEAFLLAAAAKSQLPGVFNIGTGIQTSLDDLVTLTSHLFKLNCDPVWGSMQPRLWDTDHWVSDPRRAEVELGWQAKIGLRDGIMQNSKWLESNKNLLPDQ
jgi:dolichol-phosphate mannosyltransferase